METNLITTLQEMQEWFIIHEVGEKNIYVITLFIFSALLIVLLAKKIKIPIVVGYVILGIVLSINTVELIPYFSTELKEWYDLTLKTMDFIPDLALAFIAFTAGNELSIKIIKKMGKTIFYIVIFQALAAFLLVTTGLLIIGQELYLALIFGAIASASSPAATIMVINEYRARGPVTSMIMAAAGLGDAVTLILFSLINPISFILFSGEGHISIINSLLVPGLEISGSIFLGIITGYISQYYLVSFEDKTKKILTIITTIAGGAAISLIFHLSPLITNMAIGFAYRNFSRRNPEISEPLETLTTPLYAIFFILAGTEIRFSSLSSSTFLIIASIYTIMRIIGKIEGPSLAASLAGASEKIKKYVGLGLLPQSGIAIALAYTIQRQYSATPEIGLLVFNIILFTSVLTEIFGPLATKYALYQSGEAEEVRTENSSDNNS
ncbi:MAG: cation:proton antiporter [Bacillota bacterium]